MSEPNWKEVCENFWYACNDGDGEMVERMIERYAVWFDEVQEEDE